MQAVPWRDKVGNAGKISLKVRTWEGLIKLNRLFNLYEVMKRANFWFDRFRKFHSANGENKRFLFLTHTVPL